MDETARRRRPRAKAIGVATDVGCEPSQRFGLGPFGDNQPSCLVGDRDEEVDQHRPRQVGAVPRGHCPRLAAARQASRAAIVCARATHRNRSRSRAASRDAASRTADVTVAGCGACAPSRSGDARCVRAHVGRDGSGSSSHAELSSTTHSAEIGRHMVVARPYRSRVPSVATKRSIRERQRNLLQRYAFHG